MLSGVYYGARSNITGKEEWLVYAAFATRECLRQEENQYMANDLSKIVEHNQKPAGFGARKPYIGCVVNDMKAQ